MQVPPCEIKSYHIFQLSKVVPARWVRSSKIINNNELSIDKSRSNSTSAPAIYPYFLVLYGWLLSQIIERSCPRVQLAKTRY